MANENGGHGPAVRQVKMVAVSPRKAVLAGMGKQSQGRKASSAMTDKQRLNATRRKLRRMEIVLKRAAEVGLQALRQRGLAESAAGPNHGIGGHQQGAEGGGVGMTGFDLGKILL